MRILWVVNTIFPDFSKHLGLPKPVIGGWLYGMAKSLRDSGVELHVATARTNTSGEHQLIEGINYYLLNSTKPITEYDSALEQHWKRLLLKIDPDLIHIHGTEYALGLPLLEINQTASTVISIQGLISSYPRYFHSGISLIDQLKSTTLRDIIRRDLFIRRTKKFKERANTIEKKYFKLNGNFIGRTTWDHARVLDLSHEAKYHFCNESLRDPFYSSSKWNISKCRKNSIFLSQAGYSIKGLHQVLKAMPRILKEFPNTSLRIAGNDITNNQSIKKKFSMGGYGKYIRSLIRKLKLGDNIMFTGFLDENQMITEYLQANVFICPSSIENSPNSLGEAQILGVPSIGSYVGGVPDMITHGETGLLYRFEEVEMLSFHVRSLFINSKTAENLSTNAIRIAEKRHDRVNNLENTLKIYNKIIVR